MSEYVELGGYIVSGSPLVYPDNTTMTGDGTVESPFGVKSTDVFVQYPLFTGNSGTSAYIGLNNETVLWSGSINISTEPVITANESVKNFEKVEFIGKSYPTDLDVVFGTCFFNTQSDGNTVWLFGHAGGSNGAAIRFNQFRVSANNDILAIDQTRQFSITGTGTTTATTPSVLTKIVGINRKA